MTSDTEVALTASAYPVAPLAAEASLEIGRPSAACYNQLLRVEEIPRFMDGVRAVKRLGNNLTRWTTSSPMRPETFDVEFRELVDDQHISWRRVDGSASHGEIVLEPVGPERTIVRMRRAVDDPRLGSNGTGAASILQALVIEDLARFKRLVEAKPRHRGALPRRVDMPCALAGFTAPPCAVHIQFLPVAGKWNLIALTAPGRPPAVARWLEPYGPTSIRIAPGLAPKMLTATFDRLPAAWEDLVTTVRVRFMALTSDGSASLFVEGPPYHGERFVTTRQLVDPRVRGRRVTASLEKVRLTPRQTDILSLAVALGYYEVPHKLNLRALAERLNLSLGTVAEALRRAESQVLTAYVDARSLSRWAEQTDPTRIDPPA